MIQAKVLRSGNKVYNQTGDVITIQQIHFNNIGYDGQVKLVVSNDLVQMKRHPGF